MNLDLTEFKGSMLCENRLRNLEQLTRALRNVPGDFAEFGVHAGKSARLLAKMMSDTKRLHLFDSWQGISAPGPSDTINLNEGDLMSTLHTAKQNLGDYVDVCFFYRGWIKDTIANIPSTISFAHVDLDLYEPTKLVLETLLMHRFPACVVVDDYCPRFAGVMKAVDEVVYEYNRVCINAFGECKLGKVVIPGNPDNAVNLILLDNFNEDLL